MCVGDGDVGILGGRTGRPSWITIAPMVEDHVATGIGDILCHDAQQLIVCVEGDLVWGPIEAVLMEGVVGPER